MWIEKLSSALGLEPFEQDWGICNADPRRLSEFIRFFQTNTVDDPWEPEALAELIFESMNDALDGPSVAAELEEQFRAFVRNNSCTFPQTLGYWRTLVGNDEFSASRLIDDALG